MAVSKSVYRRRQRQFGLVHSKAITANPFTKLRLQLDSLFSSDLEETRYTILSIINPNKVIKCVSHAGLYETNYPHNTIMRMKR
jgi:hypothetical protein